MLKQKSGSGNGSESLYEAYLDTTSQNGMGGGTVGNSGQLETMRAAALSPENVEKAAQRRRQAWPPNRGGVQGGTGKVTRL